MTEEQTIRMKRCPHCGTNWIQQESDDSCEECAPTALIGVAIYMLHEAVENASLIPAKLAAKHLSVLKAAHAKLSTTIEEVERYKNDHGLSKS